MNPLQLLITILGIIELIVKIFGLIAMIWAIIHIKGTFRIIKKIKNEIEELDDI